jgi:hypothetical protein
LSSVVVDLLDDFTPYFAHQRLVVGSTQKARV